MQSDSNDNSQIAVRLCHKGEQSNIGNIMILD